MTKTPEKRAGPNLVSFDILSSVIALRSLSLVHIVCNSYCMTNCVLAYLLLKFLRARSTQGASAIKSQCIFGHTNNLLVVGANLVFPIRLCEVFCVTLRSVLVS